MEWTDRHRQESQRWYSSDPRWLGTPTDDEWDRLFADRRWLIDLPPWHLTVSRPGVVTADLVYDPGEVLHDRVPIHAYLAAAHQLPAGGADGSTPPVLVQAGTPARILGFCIFEDQMYRETMYYVWETNGQTLSGYPPKRGSRTDLLASSLVPALVVPATSPLATVEAGSDLVVRAHEMAAAQWSAHGW